jgi:hypothetical protein
MSSDDVDIGTGKNILKSKTFWANLLSLIIFVAAYFFGYTLTPETYAVVVPLYYFFLNATLRAVTNEKIVWS